MPLYERRKNGKVVERVQTVPRSYEDTRIGLIIGDGGKIDDRPGESWHVVDETKPAPAAKPEGNTSGG
jgi:hypothetical protein